MDSSANLGGHSALAIDASGWAHVSYYDNTSGNLKYAYRDGAGWHREAVDSVGDVGEYTSIALDAADRPHISYYDYTNQDLKYAYYDGAAWQIEAVDTAGSTGFYTSIAMDTDDRPHISYYDSTSQDLKYAYYDGAAWQIETVDGTGYVGQCSSLALDAADEPRISYFAPLDGFLKYAEYSSFGQGAGVHQGWQIEVVDWGGELGEYASVAVDGTGHPHISYYDDIYANLRHAWHDGMDWQIEMVDAIGKVGQYTSLRLDASGAPHISYYDEGNTGLKYAYDDGMAWQVETVDDTGNVGSYTSLALDPAGVPYISYYDADNGDLKLAIYNGSWQTETVDASGDVGQYTSLALDSADRPHISYYDASDGQLLYAYYDGAAWITMTVEGGNAGQYNSLALDSADRPHISYYKAGAGDLHYAHFDGAAWNLETVDVEGYVGRYSSLALDGAGHPHISYCDDTADDLKLAFYDGAQWQVEVVDEEGLVGSYTSLVLDAAGRPHIAYRDEGAGNLKYAQATCVSVSGAEIEGPTQLLVDETGAYTATYLPPTATPTVTLTWDDGTVGPTAAYSWTQAGVYSITVTAVNPCGQGNGSLTVTVCPETLEASFNWVPSVPIVSKMVTFYADMEGTLPTVFGWDFGDGGSGMGQVVEHTYTEVGTYTVRMTATNDCGQVARADVVRVVKPEVQVGTLPPVVAGPGEIGVEVLSLGSSGDYTLTWSLSEAPPVEWLFEVPGSGAIAPAGSTDVTVTYTAPMASGLYTTVLVISSSDPFSPEVGVEVSMLVSGCLPITDVDFVWLPPTPTAGQPVTFTAMIVGSGPFTYTWDLGDGTTSDAEQVVHTYALTGPYTVSLEVANACSQLEVAHNLIVLESTLSWEIYLPVVLRGYGP